MPAWITLVYPSTLSAIMIICFLCRFSTFWLRSKCSIYDLSLSLDHSLFSPCLPSPFFPILLNLSLSQPPLPCIYFRLSVVSPFQDWNVVGVRLLQLWRTWLHMFRLTCKTEWGWVPIPCQQMGLMTWRQSTFHLLSGLWMLTVAWWHQKYWVYLFVKDQPLVCTYFCLFGNLLHVMGDNYEALWTCHIYCNCHIYCALILNEIHN